MILVLAVIYVAFISLGLPDSLFGVAWPLMHVDFKMPESFASVYMIICSGGTSMTSLFTGKLIRRFGTGTVTVVSVLLTAVGLLGISFVPNIWAMIPFSVILGTGAGAVDSGLNNFVANHYKPWHMSWLHCFWGIGVTISPLIMAYFLKSDDWRNGYSAVAIIQFAIATAILFSLPAWKKIEKGELSYVNNTDNNVSNSDNATYEKRGILSLVKSRGVFLAMLGLGLYCAMEFTVGLWGASYLLNTKKVSTAASAALWISLYYGGIMVGRFITGFLTMKFSDQTLIFGGVIFALFGGLFLLLPFRSVAPAGLVLIGIGFGPVFPCSVHATPTRFGSKFSADITGFQMFFAYFLGFIVQTSFGYIAAATSFSFMPYLVFGLSIALLIVQIAIKNRTADSECVID